eukprot:SAG11_NODE_2766_length_2998_cov_1.572611_3_plen_85_part_00
MLLSLRLLYGLRSSRTLCTSFRLALAGYATMCQVACWLAARREWAVVAADGGPEFFASHESYLRIDVAADESVPPLLPIAAPPQ